MTKVFFLMIIKHLMCKFNQSYFKRGMNASLCKLNVHIAGKSFAALLCPTIITAVKKGKK